MGTFAALTEEPASEGGEVQSSLRLAVDTYPNRWSRASIAAGKLVVAPLTTAGFCDLLDYVEGSLEAAGIRTR
jgi:hypothetical protein